MRTQSHESTAATEPSMEGGKLVAYGLTLALFAAKSCYDGVGITMLLLFPFWLMAAPTAAWAMGRGVFAWCKHEMCFENYHAEERPIATRLVIGMNLIAAIMFAVFYLAIPSGTGMR